MKIKNISSSELTIIDIRGNGLGGGVTLAVNETVTIFNEDAEKSTQLRKLIDNALISVISDDEPSTGTSVANASETAILSGDKLVQFLKDDNTIATADPATYTSTHNVAKTVRLVLTDGDGSRSYLNSSSTLLVSASGGTVDGHATSTLTFTNGLASISVLKATAGVVTLTLSAFTHPMSSAIPPVVPAAVGTMGATVTFS